MSNFNLTLSPSQVEFVLKPGITLIQAYNITNNSDSAITLNTEVAPWIPEGTNGSVNYNQASDNSDIDFSLNNSDVQLGQPFIIEANSTQQLVLKIKTNSDFQISDNYYTFFVFQNQEESNISSGNNFSQATGKIGSHLLLTVSDSESPKVNSEIQDFFITPKIKDVFFTNITFNGKVKNNSDFFFKINGKIIITKNDKTIKEFTLVDSNVLNHHSRDISCSEENCQINPPLWPGHYKVSVILDPSLNTQSYDTSFYVFPISPLLFLILATGIFFGGRKIKKIFKSKSTLVV